MTSRVKTNETLNSSLDDSICDYQDDGCHKSLRQMMKIDAGVKPVEMLMVTEHVVKGVMSLHEEGYADFGLSPDRVLVKYTTKVRPILKYQALPSQFQPGIRFDSSSRQ